MAKQAAVKKQDIPDGWSVEAVDFVNRVYYTYIATTKEGR
jgi:hypothetical protein